MLLRCGQAQMRHEQLQRRERVHPAHWSPDCSESTCRSVWAMALRSAEDVFNPDFHHLELPALLHGNRGLHVNILQQP